MRASSRLKLLCLLAVSCLLLAAPAASAQLGTRSFTVAVDVTDAGPDDAPIATPDAPATVPADITVTCTGADPTVTEASVSVTAVVEDASGSPTDGIAVAVDPEALTFEFGATDCAAEDATANQTVDVTVTPDHLTIFDLPIRIAIEATVDGTNDTGTFHVKAGLIGTASVDFPVTTFEATERTSYEIGYDVMNDVNSDVKIMFDDPPEGLAHELFPGSFIACNTHADGCTEAGLSGSFDVITPDGPDPVTEEVTLNYTMTPAIDESQVVTTGSVNLTLVYAPEVMKEEAESEDSPGPVGAVLLLTLVGAALLRRRP